MSNLEDSVTLGCIIKLATVHSTYSEYNAKRSKSKTTNIDKEARYVCLMGAHAQRGWFFEMDWKSIYRHADTDFDGIKNYITHQIELRKKPSLKRKAALPKAVKVSKSNYAY